MCTHTERDTELHADRSSNSLVPGYYTFDVELTWRKSLCLDLVSVVVPGQCVIRVIRVIRYYRSTRGFFYFIFKMQTFIGMWGEIKHWNSKYVFKFNIYNQEKHPSIWSCLPSCPSRGPVTIDCIMRWTTHLSGPSVCAVGILWSEVDHDVCVFNNMSHLLTGGRRGFWTTLQSPTRWRSRFFGFTFGEMSYRSSLFTVSAFDHR